MKYEYTRRCDRAASGDKCKKNVFFFLAVKSIFYEGGQPNESSKNNISKAEEWANLISFNRKLQVNTNTT